MRPPCAWISSTILPCISQASSTVMIPRPTALWFDDDHDRHRRLRQLLQRRKNARQELHFGPLLHIVRTVLDNHPVAVEKHCRLHAVSFLLSPRSPPLRGVGHSAWTRSYFSGVPMSIKYAAVIQRPSEDRNARLQQLRQQVAGNVEEPLGGNVVQNRGIDHQDAGVGQVREDLVPRRLLDEIASLGGFRRRPRCRIPRDWGRG